MALMKADEFVRLGRTIVFYESAIADFPNSQRTERKPRSKKQLEARLADLKKQLDRAVAQGNTDAFGFGFPWNVYDTTSHGAGLSVMAAEYGFLTGANIYAANAHRCRLPGNSLPRPLLFFSLSLFSVCSVSPW